MEKDTILFIFLIGVIAASFFTYLILRAYRYNKLTKNEERGIQKSSASVKSEDKLDAGAQKR